MDGQHHLSTTLESDTLGSTPHPSSPISAAANSTSPRLHSFGRRFRSPPTAASTIVTPLEQTSVQSRNTEAVKSAKRFLLSSVRSDWEYDPASPPSPVEVTSPSRLEHVEYRRRDDGSSDPGSGAEDMRDPMAYTDVVDPYRYENPDAVAAALTRKQGKRRKLLKDEIQYNEGLRIFHARRNAWTGAVRERPKRRAGPPSSPNGNKKKHSRNNSLNLNFDFELDTPLDRSRSASPASASHVSTPPSAISDQTEENTDSVVQHPVEPTSDIDVDPLLPVAPPLLPRTNPVRAAITPSMYPTIYSKVVIQSLTPSVPIPLPDMTRAIVQGWKDEGNWPPKTTAANAMVNEAKGINGSTIDRKDPSQHFVSIPSVKEKEKREGGGMRKGMSGAFRKALNWRTSNATSHSTQTSNGGNHGQHSNSGNGRPGSAIAAFTLSPSLPRVPVTGGINAAHVGWVETGNTADTEDAEAMFE